jgi:hypothetical protein
LPLPLIKHLFEFLSGKGPKPMRHLLQLSLAALALGVLASAPHARAADMGVPYGPPPQADYGAPYGAPPAAPGYYPPPVAYDYPPPPPPAYYAYAVPPYVVAPGPYYWGAPYWRGYGARFAYGYGRWGRGWHR